MSTELRVNETRPISRSENYLQQAYQGTLSTFQAAGRHLFSSDSSPSLKDRVLFYPNQLLQSLNRDTLYKTLKVSGVTVAICCLVFLPVAAAFIPSSHESNQAQIYVCQNQVCQLMNPQDVVRDTMRQLQMLEEPGVVERMSQIFLELNKKEQLIISKLIEQSNAVQDFDNLPSLPEEAIILDRNAMPFVLLEFVTDSLMAGFDPEGRRLITVRYQEMDDRGELIGNVQNALIVEKNGHWEFIGSSGFLNRLQNPLFEEIGEARAPTFYRLV